MMNIEGDRKKGMGRAAGGVRQRGKGAGKKRERNGKGKGQTAGRGRPRGRGSGREEEERGKPGLSSRGHEGYCVHTGIFFGHSDGQGGTIWLKSHLFGYPILMVQNQGPRLGVGEGALALLWAGLLPEGGQAGEIPLSEVDGTVDEGNAEEDVAQNPWQTSVYQQPSEEGDCEEEILQTKENFSIRFLMKELGQLNHFLGLEIDRSEEGIFLHQQKYSKDLLKKFEMLNCKRISTPMEPNAKMCAHEGNDLKEATMYRKLVGDHDTRRSTTGYIFTLGSGVVSWCSKRQPTVSLSTTEAEYRAVAMAAQESTWILQLLEDLHQPIEYPISLYCNNLSAIRLAENPVFHARTKHVEVHYHFIREKHDPSMWSNGLVELLLSFRSGGGERASCTPWSVVVQSHEHTGRRGHVRLPDIKEDGEEDEGGDDGLGPEDDDAEAYNKADFSEHIGALSEIMIVG
ncbi:hypothetical protein RJ640_030992 [Escallonia rubra]|uniref:Reverse transcriptase Ty1/copia-type domain-containing protein n=1 Tax=Escallonia rubra TaxID=112253 RepID=A0AA88SAN7_9ASTE|nr:hypothetical protein RJ640_030992 [Escallonia rubra]